MNTLNKEEFRRAMDLPVTLEGEASLRQALQSLCAELLARPDLKQEPALQSMLLAVRLRLRKLQNLCDAAREDASFAPAGCELRSLAEDLCAASDLLLRPLGRTVRFEAPEERIDAGCDPRGISRLLLELVCNAARHTRGAEISITLTLKRSPHARHKKPAACVLTAESTGRVDLGKLHAAASRAGSGTAAMLRTARLHGGALLWLEREGKSVAALRMPLQPFYDCRDRTQRSNGAPPQVDMPDYVDLLSDRCSPVYTGLAQVCGA